MTSKSQHTKLTLEKKLLPPAHARIPTHNLTIMSTRSYQQAILAGCSTASKSARYESILRQCVKARDAEAGYYV